MAGKLFEYAVLYHPRTEKDDKGNEVVKKSEVIADLQRTIAKDEKEVAIVAARAIPEKYLADLELVEIIVRPF